MDGWKEVKEVKDKRMSRNKIKEELKLKKNGNKAAEKESSPSLFSLILSLAPSLSLFSSLSLPLSLSLSLSLSYFLALSHFLFFLCLLRLLYTVLAWRVITKMPGY